MRSLHFIANMAFAGLVGATYVGTRASRVKYSMCLINRLLNHLLTRAFIILVGVNIAGYDFGCSIMVCKILCLFLLVFRLDNSVASQETER